MQLSMGMFMSLMFIVGLVLTIYSFKLGPAVKNCSAAAQDAARGLVVLGVMLISISGTYMVCGCEKIGLPMKSHSVTGIGFVVLMLLIGISVIGLTSTIHKECQNARTDTPVLITIASITTLVCIVYLVYRGYSAVKKPITTGSFRF